MRRLLAVQMKQRFADGSRFLKRSHEIHWVSGERRRVPTCAQRVFAILHILRSSVMVRPMHFREVARSIEGLFDRKAHVATCHNELIKDKRFVLVGRGLYALTEWGYSAGVVKDVLREILRKEGALSRNEIIDKVRKERYVKDNTIIVNLQDTSLFKRLPDGRYTFVE